MNTPVWEQFDYTKDGIVEASAGTGKTYAIEHIVEKLVVEKRVDSIRNILLVTYTEKAAGELKSRIRAQLEKAGALADDFDEATICTIHAFCRELLTEYAFENRVPMKIEIVGSDGPLIEPAVRQVLADPAFLARCGGDYAAMMAEMRATSTDALIKQVKEAIKTKAKPPEGAFAVLLAATRAAIRACKEEAGIFSFDDLVERAGGVIDAEAAKEAAGERSPLLDSIRRRYRVALVDEFQDTDGQQWSIFGKLFSSRVNLLKEEDAPNPKRGFLLIVGDPKQAIYGFRGADIKTYLAARADIVARTKEPPRELTATYRSSPELVDAFNALFGASGWFEEMREGEYRIAYSGVTFPEDNPRFAGYRNFTGPAVTLLESLPHRFPDPEDGRIGYGSREICLPVFLENAAREIERLCAMPEAYELTEKGERKTYPYRYGDIGILFQGGSDPEIIKRALTRHGIPYSHYKEAGIFQSEEAEELLAVFDFLAAPEKTGNLAALLLTRLFGATPAELPARLEAREGLLAEGLGAWQLLAARHDWARLFERIIGDTSLARPQPGDVEYDRRWAATRQLLDHLLETPGRAARTVADFAAELRARRRDPPRPGDEGSLRRKECEADRVQIMTIHAAKGLEFKVVFCVAGFRQIKKNTPEAELRRLLYVALTRAEHKLYLPWSQWAKHRRFVRGAETEESGIGSARTPLLGQGFLAAAIRAYFDDPESAVVRPEPRAEEPAATGASPAAPRSAPSVYDLGYLKDRRMRWDSFSSLNRHESAAEMVTEGAVENDEPAPDPVASAPAPTLLPRGSVSGNVFHDIMEILCGGDDVSAPGFALGLRDEAAATADPSLRDMVRRCMRRYALSDRTTAADSTEQTLARMVWNTLNTRIEIGGKSFFLKDIPASDRRAEIEFVVDEHAIPGLEAAAVPADGVFNGRIDLLVRPEGRGGPVYVIDWKTNSLADYRPETVESAMEAAGYPLQFQLYTLAVEQWLGEGKVGGVAYLFVRGGEASGGTAGVYAQAMDEPHCAACRKAVSAALAGREGLQEER